MKNTSLYKVWFLVLIAGFAGTAVFANTDNRRQVPTDTLNYIEYRGKVVDAATNGVLPFATIEAEGSNITTVTNIDGEFTLKIAKDLNVESFKFSYLGYGNQSKPVSTFLNEKNSVIKLQPISATIKEVTIRPLSGSEMIDEILKKVKENYNTEPQMLTGFYRETIKNRRNYVSISEAVVEIYKSGYTSPFQMDQVRIDRGRKSADVEKMDTLLFKLQGGPAVSLLLDVVKNPTILLTDEYALIFEFSMDNIMLLNDRLHYVISFRQKPEITEPYYYGRLFVDMDKLAISEAEFSFNTEDKDQAARFFVQKKPIGMSIIPEAASYRASYTIQDGRWYFNYARAEVKFKVDWEKKLFNSNYSIMTEIAITDRKDQLAEKINPKERFKKTEVLDEMVYVFFEPDYWGDYNVIEPDQSIESAIRKLNRKFER